MDEYIIKLRNRVINVGVTVKNLAIHISFIVHNKLLLIQNHAALLAYKMLHIKNKSVLKSSCMLFKTVYAKALNKLRFSSKANYVFVTPCKIRETNSMSLIQNNIKTVIGRYRKLNEMDYENNDGEHLLSVNNFDDMTLGDVDFIVIEQ